MLNRESSRRLSTRCFEGQMSEVHANDHLSLDTFTVADFSVQKAFHWEWTFSPFWSVNRLPNLGTDFFWNFDPLIGNLLCLSRARLLHSIIGTKVSCILVSCSLHRMRESPAIIRFSVLGHRGRRQSSKHCTFPCWSFQNLSRRYLWVRSLFRSPPEWVKDASRYLGDEGRNTSATAKPAHRKCPSSHSSPGGSMRSLNFDRPDMFTPHSLVSQCFFFYHRTILCRGPEIRLDWMTLKSGRSEKTFSSDIMMSTRNCPIRRRNRHLQNFYA